LAPVAHNPTVEGFPKGAINFLLSRVFDHLVQEEPGILRGEELDPGDSRPVLLTRIGRDDAILPEGQDERSQLLVDLCLHPLPPNRYLLVLFPGPRHSGPLIVADAMSRTTH